MIALMNNDFFLGGLCTALIVVPVVGIDRPQSKKTMKDDDKKRKEVERISRHIHPHDDEPDPTIWGTTTFLRCYSSHFHLVS